MPGKEKRPAQKEPGGKSIKSNVASIATASALCNLRGQLMSIHCMNVDAGAPPPDSETAAFIRTVQRQRAWRLFPYGEWTERGGSRVIFDRQYRPICRIHTNGRVEIVRPETWISHIRQRFFHRGFGPSPDAATKAAALNVMRSCSGMETELRRRRDLERRGILPRWATKPNLPNSRSRPAARAQGSALQ